jgi:hypothetical protein
MFQQLAELATILGGLAAAATLILGLIDRVKKPPQKTNE